MSSATRLFLGVWAASMVGAGLIAALVLGRPEVGEAYRLQRIAAESQVRYAPAVAELGAGGVLYWRMSMRVPGGVVAGGPGAPAEFRYDEQIILEMWSVYAGARGGRSRTEMSTLDGELLLVAESDGFETVHREVASGFEWRREGPRPDEIESVLVPTIVLWQQYGLSFELVGRGEPRDGRETLVVAVEHPVTEPRERTELTFVEDDPIVSRLRNYDIGEDGELILTSEMSLLDWAVLPAETELGMRP